MIREVLIEPLLGGFFHDDQAALRVGARDAARVPAAAVGIGLVLDDGAVVWGDAVSVQYAGVGGRDPIVRAEMLDGWDIRGLEPARWLEATDAACAGVTHSGLRYGISQALLAAAAHERGVTMAEVVADEFGLELVAEPVPLFAQSGEARYEAVPRMIAKRVDALPHGLFSTPEAFAGMLDFARWVRDRVAEVPGYAPTLHFDLYGQAGLHHDDVAGFLLEIERACAPYPVRVESPVDFGSREAQISGLAALRRELAGATCRSSRTSGATRSPTSRRSRPRAPATWCGSKTPDVGSLADSARAVLTCRAHGISAYLGGSCTETRGVGARLRARGRRHPPGRATRQARDGRRRGHHAGLQPAGAPACAPEEDR